MDDGYTTGEWNGLPNFDCSSCPYSVLDEDSMRLHVAQRHGAGVIDPFAERDRFGNPTQEPVPQSPTTPESPPSSPADEAGAALIETVSEGADSHDDTPSDGGTPPDDSTTAATDEHTE
jgi:hypothetical protein